MGASVIFLIHGDQEFLCGEQVAVLEQQYASEEGLGDIGRVRLTGKGLTLSDLETHCDALPFLTDWQVVQVDGYLTALMAASQQGSKQAGDDIERLLNYFPHLPESTILIFQEPKPLPASGRIYKAIARLAEEEQAALFPCSLPKRSRDREQFVQAWLQEKAHKLNLRFRRDGLALLSASVGDDLRSAQQDLEKIRAYLGPDKEIRAEDVQLLVDKALQSNVFQMISALTAGRSRQAVILLQSLLAAGEHPLALLAMIVRQYRLYIGMKSLAEEGLSPEEIAAQMKLREWMVERDLRTARRLSWTRLEAIYDRLLSTDVAIKEGQLDSDLALQLLVVELSR